MHGDVGNPRVRDGCHGLQDSVRTGAQDHGAADDERRGQPRIGAEACRHCGVAPFHAWAAAQPGRTLVAGARTGAAHCPKAVWVNHEPLE
ncbi:hypothetical protein [Streptomyces sp. LRa12]|uniref:hypothetical protein n=1 Tax=Streptomyces TaxID=1883 RepID=UPI0019D0808D|nr:hypothetical protein [Streptomyces sp. LRa12]